MGTNPMLPTRLLLHTHFSNIFQPLIHIYNHSFYCKKSPYYIQIPFQPTSIFHTHSKSSSQHSIFSFPTLLFSFLAFCILFSTYRVFSGNISFFPGTLPAFQYISASFLSMPASFLIIPIHFLYYQLHSLTVHPYFNQYAP